MTALCLLGGCGVLLGLVSYGVHLAVRAPESPYRVAVMDAGEECHQPSDEGDAALIVDRETGEVLRCATVVAPWSGPGPGRAEAVGPFDAAEVARVVQLTASLTADGAGLSEADEDVVDRLVAQISEQNGHGERPETTVQTAARVLWGDSLGYGLIALLLGGVGLWSSHNHWGATI